MHRLLLVLLLLLQLTASAQVDTAFWFVAPDVTEDNQLGGGNLDRPVLLRFFALGKASQVKVTQPANPAFPVQTLTVAANQTAALDLTAVIQMIENRPANRVLNTGLYITATNPITAYYEVFPQCGCNTDIFSLKGRNALGTEFFTPFQSEWDNHPFYLPAPTSSFDIVATEDSTSVTIFPTAPIVGHAPGVAFTIRLNRGQAFSATATSQLAADHLSGSKITSNKPIAVTLKDDALLSYDGCGGADLAGDQLIPTSRIGKEYIVVKGDLTTEKIYIVATKPGTVVYLHGSTFPVTTLSEGQTYELDLAQNATYLRATEPVYVLHMSGGGCELSAGILPGLACTGSRQVSYTRSNPEQLYFNLIVKAGAQGGFRVNGGASVIRGSYFSQVPGTNGQYLAARVTIPPSVLAAGATATITNILGVFQMGALNGSYIAPGGTFAYGYFSDFRKFDVDLGPDRQLCNGAALRFTTGIGPATYLWSTGSTDSSIVVNQSGTYWVQVQRDGCEATDTVQIEANAVAVTLGPDTAVCEGDLVQLQARTQATEPVTYLWSSGETAPEISVSRPGDYWVRVSLASGCSGSDTVQVAVGKLPAFSLGTDTLLCENERITLEGPAEAGLSYRWSNGFTQRTVTVSDPGVYWLEVMKGGCANRDTITVDRGPCFFEIPNIFSPNKDAGQANEYFVIRSTRRFQWRVTILDRWGVEVYRNPDYKNDWDAAGLPAGIYFYAVEKVGTSEYYKGWLEVVR